MREQRMGYLPQFEFYLSAFVSAARSVTFALQAVMSKYPGFGEWYPSRRDHLAQSALARFFVTLRNHAQKVGTLPIQGGVSGISARLDRFGTERPG
jgi:hypothetical protein